MSTEPEQREWQPEDLLTMPDGDNFELVDGRLVERNMGKWSSYVAGNTYQRLSEGHVRLAPDLAVEVISPNDLAYEIDEKVDEYETAGVKLIWIVNPETKMVRVHRADGTVTVLREKDALDGEDVVPGFRCPVADLFLPAS